MPIHRSRAPRHPNLAQLQRPRVRRYGIDVADSEGSDPSQIGTLGGHGQSTAGTTARGALSGSRAATSTFPDVSLEFLIGDREADPGSLESGCIWRQETCGVAIDSGSILTRSTPSPGDRGDAGALCVRHVTRVPRSRPLRSAPHDRARAALALAALVSGIPPNLAGSPFALSGCARFAGRAKTTTRRRAPLAAAVERRSNDAALPRSTSVLPIKPLDTSPPWTSVSYLA